jgi:hypothetical protein
MAGDVITGGKLSRVSLIPAIIIACVAVTAGVSELVKV